MQGRESVLQERAQHACQKSSTSLLPLPPPPPPAAAASLGDQRRKAASLDPTATAQLPWLLDASACTGPARPATVHSTWTRRQHVIWSVSLI